MVHSVMRGKKLHNEKKLRVSYQGHVLYGDVVGSSPTPSMMLLHGAGRSCRNRLLQFRTRLLEQNLTSLAIDFIGHGETAGPMTYSSLQSRTEQACTAINAYWERSKPVVVLGIRSYLKTVG